MRRGDIYYADLNPTVGTEIYKKRPVLIVSNNASNRYSETVTIVPLTSQVSRVYSFEVLLKQSESSLNKDSKAQCQQVRTISKQRITGVRIGFIRDMGQINSALRLHLGL